MPASVRAHMSRATSSRPYDRRSPTTDPAHLSQSLPHASPIQTPDVNLDTAKTPAADADAASESDVPPDRPGLPTYADYKRIETGYLLSLSPRKRDKALITQAMFDKIWDVLHQPEACTIDTPQFRFWVRKMFTLSRPPFVGGDGDLGLGWGEERGDGDGDADEVDLELERSMGIEVGRNASDADALGVTAVVLHENRPVAIMEQLYELFCYCHVRAGHGGRDKTCAVIREHYSWVPKELTAQFVKACPTCTMKRSGQCVGVGLFGHKRLVGRTRKGRAVASEVPEETSVSVGTLNLGWPTTGGPLDPANPDPCGVRERQLRGLGDVGTVQPPSPASSSLGIDSRTQSVPRDASPLAEKHRLEGTKQRERSPTKMGLATSSASAESLDEHSNVNLSGREPDVAASGHLRPLRLLGNIPSDLAGSSTYPLQIDPVLLSFNYPGLGLSSEPGFASDAGDAVGLGLTLGTGTVSETYEFTNLPGQRVHRLRAPSDVSMSLTMPLPALDPSSESDSSDSSFEHALSLPYTPTTEDAVATLPLSLSMEFMSRGRHGSWYGYRDGPLSMLYPCSGDEVGHELDGPLSFSIMTDA